MPNSGSEYDELVKRIIGRAPVSSVLDVGIGAGKMGGFVKAIHPNALIYGVESHGAYAEKFAVAWAVYHKRFIGDAMEYSLANPRARFDIVILGDVIEHFWLRDVQSFISFWTQRSTRVLAVWPTGFRQDDAGGVESEIHRCEPTLADFVRFDVREYHKIPRTGIAGHKHLVLIQGAWVRK